MPANLFWEGLVIFAAVAALQVPGKSNFAIISLATRHRPGDVFVGGALGLSGATLVSVAIGYGAETALAPYLEWVKIAGGLVLIGFGLRELRWGPGEPLARDPPASSSERTARRVRLLACGFAFLLEMGDNTQILAILFVASTHNVVLVYVATASALVAIAAVSCTGARRLMARMPEQRMRLILGALLMAVGALTILLTLEPGLLLRLL